MPSVSQSYEVILDFTNDTHDSATVQLLRDYGRASNRIVLLDPGETVSLVLDAGDTYKYTLKTKYKVVNITYASILFVFIEGLKTFLPPLFLNQQSPCMERRCLRTIAAFSSRLIALASSIRSG
ncbi:hypothetical protein EW145_g543 [Phellinidium pouzarii]|uniref:Uncharacterized protein n=1 Tax=Phellinidium pouzarii TaxID=167371 RepID=A0A4V3XDY5_9AGAM|nr:hypothetical protein EW145_g543 [Phellinidium pouzarii]